MQQSSFFLTLPQTTPQPTCQEEFADGSVAKGKNFFHRKTICNFISKIPILENPLVSPCHSPASNGNFSSFLSQQIQGSSHLSGTFCMSSQDHPHSDFVYVRTYRLCSTIVMFFGSHLYGDMLGVPKYCTAEAPRHFPGSALRWRWRVTTVQRTLVYISDVFISLFTGSKNDSR